MSNKTKTWIGIIGILIFIGAVISDDRPLVGTWYGSDGSKWIFRKDKTVLIGDGKSEFNGLWDQSSSYTASVKVSDTNMVFYLAIESDSKFTIDTFSIYPPGGSLKCNKITYLKDSGGM